VRKFAQELGVGVGELHEGYVGGNSEEALEGVDQRVCEQGEQYADHERHEVCPAQIVYGTVPDQHHAEVGDDVGGQYEQRGQQKLLALHKGFDAVDGNHTSGELQEHEFKTIGHEVGGQQYHQQVDVERHPRIEEDADNNGHNTEGYEIKVGEFDVDRPGEQYEHRGDYHQDKGEQAVRSEERR